MKVKQNMIIFLFFLKLYLALAKTNFKDIETWSSELLFNYAKLYVMPPRNPYLPSFPHYMLLDPEHYLGFKNDKGIINKMKLLYDKFNIVTYVILISHLELEEYDRDSEIIKFVSYFNYLIKKDNPNYKDEISLTTVFFIKDRKMRMRTGKSIRKIISDNDALEILNRRKDSLRDKDYYKTVISLLNDIYLTYENNYEFYNSFLYRNRFKIIISIIFIIIGSIYLYKHFTYIPESIREKKLKEFLRDNKNKKINKVFNESCIICLEKFVDENEELKKNNDDTKQNEEQKTSILDCGHKFHEYCIVEWLKNHDKCPICRIDIKYGNYKNETNAYRYIPNFSLSFERSIEDIISDMIDIQIDSYHEEINRDHRESIISRLIGSTNTNNDNNYSHTVNYSNNDRDFGDFDYDSGGATSDW